MMRNGYYLVVGILWSIYAGCILSMIILLIWGCSPLPDITPPSVTIEVRCEIEPDIWVECGHEQ